MMTQLHLLCLVVLAASCSRSASTPRFPQPAFIESVLRTTPTYQRVMREARHAAWYVFGNVEGDFVDISVGDDGVEITWGVYRFDTWERLRIYRDGQAQVLADRVEMRWRKEPVLPVEWGTRRPVDWDVLRQACARQIPEWFDDTGIAVTSFARIGHLRVAGKTYEVVTSRAALAGMLAPRGQGYVVLLDERLTVAARFNWPLVSVQRPDGARLILFGMQEVPGTVPSRRLAEHTRDDETARGNVIDFSAGLDQPVLDREPIYGSSGGIEEDPWERADDRD